MGILFKDCLSHPVYTFPMPWHAQLDLHYLNRPHNGTARTVAHHAHQGPLRILQSHYPEGQAVCHNTLVHPPGGLVGGDTLDITVRIDSGAHGLITTPGATRFYRSEGEPALQRTRVEMASGSRLEWLPLETIAYSGCLAENRLELDLAPEAECLAWDVTALGLPHANLPFEQGQLQQHVEVKGAWLERGRLAAHHTRLLDSPLGLAGQRCTASLFFACGSPLAHQRRETALEVAQHTLHAHELREWAGVTAPNDQVVVVRVLGPQVEPVMQLLRQVWAGWRHALWDLPAEPPRIWAM